MKKLFAIFAVLAFTAGMAFGQNETTVNQQGTNQQATVEQVGDLNDVLINQGMTGTLANNKDGEATVYQNGTNNDAEIDQVGGRNKEATIMQDGIDNEALITQSGTGNYVEVTIATQDQTGERNEAEIVQLGRAIKATQTQFGNDNYAYVKQLAYVDAYQDQGDESSQGQEGNRNEAIIESQGQNFAANRSQATQWQVGDDNYAWMWQQGQQNNVATHQQFGDWNKISTKQAGAHNTILITQNNDNNEVAGITKDGSLLTFDPAGFGFQDGNDNDMTILQDGLVGGIANKIGFYQTDGAWADIHQVGEGNLTLIHQESGIATVTQGGTNNVANVTQGTGL